MVYIDGNVLKGRISNAMGRTIGIKDASGNSIYIPHFKEFILNIDSINFSNIVEPQDFILSEKAITYLGMIDGKEYVNLIGNEMKDSKILDDIDMSFKVAQSTFNEYIKDTIQLSKYESDFKKVSTRCGGFGHVYAVGLKLNFKISKKIIKWVEIHPENAVFLKKKGKVPHRLEFMFKLDHKSRIMTLPFCVKAKAVATRAFFDDLSERDETYRIPLKGIHMVKKKLN